MGGVDLLTALGISLGFNLLLFIPAYAFQTDKLTDLSYGATFILLAWLALFAGGATPLTLLLAAMVTLWGLRLAGYLVIRIRKIDRDKRFDGIRERFIRFLGFWLLQGVSVWVIMLPSLRFFESDPVGGSLLSVGFLLWCYGLLFEAIADYQKYAFLNDPKNKGRWIDTGLWRYSRHPNYFGEILVWVGIYLFAFNSLGDVERLYALAGPLFITFLLLFVSGLPQLEKGADRKWGKLAAYRKYKKETSILIPWLR